jgi:hypothetical protein
MTVTGKVQKYKLRQHAIAELSREPDCATQPDTV